MPHPSPRGSGGSKWRPWASGASASINSTVGAPLKWVTFSLWMSSMILGGSTARSITCFPPTPDTAQGKAPAVAVEERQRPQKRTVPVELVGVHRAHGVQVRTAVGVHHALGATRRPRGVVDRRRAELVVDVVHDREHRRAVDELLIGGAVERSARHPGHRVFDVHEGGARVEGVGDVANDRRELRVGHHQLRPGVIQDVADLFRLEPGVDGHQHPMHLEDGKVRGEQFGDVWARERPPGRPGPPRRGAGHPAKRPISSPNSPQVHRRSP